MMKRLRRIILSKPFLALALILALYSGVGFLLAPHLARHYGPRLIREKTGLKAKIGEVRFNPYSLRLELKGVDIDGQDGSPMLGFDRLRVKLAWRSLIKQVWTVERVELRGLTVRLVVERDGGMNLARLAPASRTSDQAPPPGQGPPPLMVRELALDQASIEVLDRRPDHPTALGLQSLQITASSLTTLPGRTGSFSLAAKVREGGAVRLEGRLNLRPLAVNGELTIDGLETATLFQFAGLATNLMPPAGSISVSTAYRFASGDKDWQAALTGLKLKLQDVGLRLRPDSAPLLTLPRLSLAGGIDLAARRVDIDRLGLEGGVARVTFQRTGGLNWAQIAATPGPPGQTPAQGQGSAPAPSAPARPWTVEMRELAVDGLAVDYHDLRRVPEVEAAIGKLRLTLSAQAELGDGPPKVEIDRAEIEASNLQAGQTGAKRPMLAINRFKAAGGELDLAAKGYALDAISLDGGRIEVRRLANGGLNLERLLSSPGQADKIGGTTGKKRKPAAQPASGPAPHFLVKKVSVSGMEADLFDELTAQGERPLLSVKDLTINAKDIDGNSPIPYQINLKLTTGGALRASGLIHLQGPAVEGTIDARRLNLTPIQPYLTQVARVRLASGLISSQGRLRYGFPGQRAENGYAGGLAIDNLRLTETNGKETLIGFKALVVRQMRLRLAPASLDIGDLRLKGPEGKIVIGKDHRLNLASMFSRPTGQGKAAPAPAPGAKPKRKNSESFRYRVRRVMIDDGRVDFADLSLFTPFGARIHGLRGVVAGVSSEAGSRATVQLDGLVDRYGEAKIRGSLAPADPKRFTDLALDFRNLEMARLTPYSGTFAGRRIDSGKLSADLKYKINNGELKGDNRFVVERLTLGDKVESTEAVGLPLDLAVALLEDSHGVIDLGLPVSGDLNSPKFSYSSLVWKALTSLITKIVTSPFRLLGALLPGLGDDNALKSVQFEAGSRTLPPPEKEKLAHLAQALRKRPQLALTITGGYVPESDRTELQRRQATRELDVLLGQPPLSADDPGPVDFASPETQKGLQTLFVRRFGSQALGQLRREAKAHGAEEEQNDGQLARLTFARLAAGERLNDHDLNKLAEARAQVVAVELTQADGVAKERLAIQPAQALAPGDKIEVRLDLKTSR